MKYYLILDIGGTKTTSVVFDENGAPVTEFMVFPSRTYEGEDAVFQNTIEAGYAVLNAAGIDKADILGVGVAAPGPLDYKTGLIIDVPMMGWKNFPLGDRLRKEFGVPVYVENDGNLGLLLRRTLELPKAREQFFTRQSVPAVEAVSRSMDRFIMDVPDLPENLDMYLSTLKFHSVAVAITGVSNCMLPEQQ